VQSYRGSTWSPSKVKYSLIGSENFCTCSVHINGNPKFLSWLSEVLSSSDIS
jgi:hypothetical protein